MKQVKATDDLKNMLLKLDKDEMAFLLARLKGQSQGQVHKIENTEESDEYV